MDNFSSLSDFKKQAISSILSSINVKFPYIKKDLTTLIKSNQSSFDTLLGLYKFDEKNISSSQISAIYLLSYIDLYSLYIILYTNSYIYNGIKLASYNKYLYASLLYKDIQSMLKEKELLNTYDSAMYTNFLNTNKVDIQSSQSTYISKNLNGILSFTDILTLPIDSTKTINPKTIILSDNDKSIHETINNTNTPNIDYSILRKQYNKIGISGTITTTNKDTKYGLVPEIYGTIRGYVSDQIYIIVDNITYTNSTNLVISTITLKTSTNGNQWSDLYTINPDIESDILIENNITTGLKILLRNNYGLTVNDSWKINIRYIHIDDPSIVAKVKFGLLEQVSYIKYVDMSRYNLTNTNLSYKENKYEHIKNCSTIYTQGINTIAPIESSIDEFIIKTQQKDCYQSNYNGSFVYNYNFNIQDINAVINNYMQSGCISFSPIIIENINSIALNMSYYINNELLYLGSLLKQRMFIESNIIIYNDNSKIEIPILNNKSSSKTVELASPVSINEALQAKINLRFPLNKDKSIKIYDVNNNTVSTLLTSDIHQIVNDMYYITIDNYQNDNSYIIEYYIKEYNFNDISNNTVSNKWNVYNNIAYSYYRNIDEEINIFIGNVVNNSITNISGNCVLSLAMKSIDAPYMTPFVYECSLLFN